MIRPMGAGDDFAREAKAFQAWHRAWYLHHIIMHWHSGQNSLAMPNKQLINAPILKGIVSKTQCNRKNY